MASFNMNIVVPTAGLGNGGQSEEAAHLPQALSGKLTPTRRGSGDLTPGSLASPVPASGKRRKWRPLKKLRRLFSRSGQFSEETLGEVATNEGSVIKYTPGPDSIGENLTRRRSSAPEPINSSPLALARTFGEVTPSSATSQSPPVGHYAAYNYTSQPSKSSPFMRAGQAPVEEIEGGDQPVQLTVKLIKRLQDRHEDPLVNSRQVELKRGKKGFGLVLGGSNPVLVLRIDPNGAADRAGVLVGDMIVAVNDIDVRRSTYAHVNQMICLASKTEAQLDDSTEGDDVQNTTTREEVGAKKPEGSSSDKKAAAHITNKERHAETSNVEPPARSNIILDLTAEDDFAASSRTATPSSLNSFISSNTSDASEAAAGSAWTSQKSTSPTLEVIGKGHKENLKTVDVNKTVTKGESLKVNEHPQILVETTENESNDAVATTGFGALIRKQSQIIRRQRHSVAVMEYSHLPLAANSEEDARILELLKQQHSGLLAEAKEKSERVRLDDERIDSYDNSERVTQPPNSIPTPDKIASERLSDDKAKTDSKSEPSSPNQQRHNKLCRSHSQKGSAIIIEHKSGRILGTAPKARPSILPSEIAARVVETGRTKAHPDSGYVSMCQDEMNTDLENALMSASIKVGNPKDKQTPSQLEVKESARRASEGTPGKEATTKKLKEAEMRQSVRAVAVGESDSRSLTLPNSRQRKPDSLLLPSSTPESKHTLAPHRLGGMRRVNSARIIQKAAANKETGIAKEERKSPQATEDVPDWVRLAKNKAKRRSIHEQRKSQQSPDMEADQTPSVEADTSKRPVTSPHAQQSITNASPVSASPVKVAAKSKPLSASKAMTLPRVTEENRQAPSEDVKDKGAKRRLSFVMAQELCLVCKKPVYHSERFSAEGLVFHAACIKCTICQRKLSLDKFALLQQKIYCQVHAQEISTRLAPNISTGGSLAKMSVRGGALQ